MTENVFEAKSLIALRRLLPIAAVLFALAVLCAAPVGAAEQVMPVEITPSYDWYTTASADAETYEIGSIEDLVGLANIVKGADGQTKSDFAGKTVKLTADLTFADGEYWYYNDGSTPVYDYQIKTFAGKFDGNTHTITGLKFYNTHTVSPSVGLFETLKRGGNVTNLTLDTITADLNDRDRFGFIAMFLQGNATNCHVKNVSATVNVVPPSGTNGYTSTSGGMFAQITSATVTSCTANNVTITCFGADNTDHVGSLIGLAGGTAELRSTIKDCSIEDITFDCTRKTKRTGGFIGSTSYTDVIDCTAKDVKIEVDTYYQHVGGFVGLASTASTYENCKVVGFTMNGGSEDGDMNAGQVGGFAGYSSSSSSAIAVSFTECSVTGLDMNLVSDYSNQNTGGFIGYPSGDGDLVISDCSVSGKITATGLAATIPVGGFIGKTNNKEIEVTGSSADVDIDTIGIAGGFVGSGSSGTFTDCTANGAVSGPTAGGFFGAITPNTADPETMPEKTVTVTGCKANGQVLGTETASGFVGTLATAGEDNANPTTVTITGSTASPVVAGASSTTTVNDFTQDVTPDTSEKTYTPSESNTPAGETVKVLDDKTLSMDENGQIHIPDGTTVQLGTEENPITVQDEVIVTGDGLNIQKSGSTITPTEEKFTVTYGETIDLTVNINKNSAEPELVSNAKSSRSAAPQDQVSHDYVRFFYGETQLGNDVEITYSDGAHTAGTATLTYNTIGGILPVGEDVSITVKYGGSVYLDESTAEITVRIEPKELTVTGLTVEDKVYDGTTAITVTGGEFTDVTQIITDDDVSIGDITATVDNANVGTNKPVTLSITLIGADSGDYTAVSSNEITVNITPAGSTVTGETIEATYGGKIQFSIDVKIPTESELVENAKSSRSAAQQGTVPQDTVWFLYGDTKLGEATVTYTDTTNTSGTATFTYDTTNGALPIGQTVTVSAKYGGSKNLAPSTETITVTIAKQELTVTGLTVPDKIYDGTTTIPVTGGQLAGVIEGDEVVIGDITATVDDANVGTNKPVTLSITLTGKDCGNYTVVLPKDITANITPADSRVTSETIEATYGEQIEFSVEIAKAQTLTNVKNSRSAASQDTVPLDSVWFTYNGELLGQATITYNDETNTKGKATLEYKTTAGIIPIGENNKVTAEFGGSINLLGKSGEITVNLKAKELTITGLKAEGRNYDGTTTVTLKGGTLQGIVGTDDVSATMPKTGTIDSANAGSYEVNFDPITLTGTKAGFYTLTAQPDVTVTISYAETIITLHANHTTECGHTSEATVSFDATHTAIAYQDGNYLPVYPGYPGNTGYTILGWYTEGGVEVIDASGNLVPSDYTDANGKWVSFEPVQLYAHWKANTTTITLDPNGNAADITPGDSRVTATYLQTIPSFKAPTKIHEGDPTRICHLAGWYTAAEGGTKILTNDGKLISDIKGYSNPAGQWINESATLTLYAHWNHDTTPYTVNIHKETLIAGVYDDEPHKYGGYVDETVTYTPPEYTGFTFDAKNSTTSGTVEADGSLVLDLYYKRNSYEVTLSTGTGNGVESVSGTGTYKYNETVTISMTLKDGYKFYHWDISEGVASTNQDLSKNPATFEMPADRVNLIAHALPIVYNITYELDGGDNNRANSGKYTIEDSVSLLSASREGYFFDGWYLDAAFTEQTTGWAAGNTGDKTVYAKWLVNYSISDDSTQIVEQGQPATFVSAADYSKFVEVEIDGNVIDSTNYEVTEGSTKVTLKGSYVKTLSVGEHTIVIRSNDGEARATFTVTEASSTPVTPSSPSSGSQGSSVWLTETPTPTPTTPTTTPTDPELAPTEIPTTQPTETQTTSPLSIAAVVAGLGAALVLRRR